MGIGPNEAVRFHAFRGVLFDNSGGLVEAVRSVRRWPDAVALVFNGRRGRPIGLASFPTGEAAPGRFEFREHGSRLSLAVGADAMRGPAPMTADYRASAAACRPLPARSGARRASRRRGNRMFNTRTARAECAHRGCVPDRT